MVPPRPLRSFPYGGSVVLPCEIGGGADAPVGRGLHDWGGPRRELVMISPERLTGTKPEHPAEHARLGVDSEVGVLRRVILHRPGLELQRLTPSNKDELLFDDVLWVKRARQEHDAFADTLAERGRRGPLPRRSCSPRRSRIRPLPRRSSATRSPSSELGHPARRARARLAAAPAAGGRGRGPDRRRDASASCRSSRPASSRRRPTADDFVARAAAEPPLHPRHLRAGSTAASASTRWPRPPAGARRCTSTRSTATTRSSPGATLRDLERRPRRPRACSRAATCS